MTEAEVGSRKPWQMTQKEYVDDLSDTFVPIVFGTQVGSKVRWRGTGEKAQAKQKADIVRGAPEAHRYHVRKALEANEPVPAEVLKDYPDLVRKEPWQMTQKEWVQKASETRLPIALGPYSRSDPELAAKAHQRIIARALSEGKPVPDGVLKDYPDLIPPSGKIVPETGIGTPVRRTEVARIPSRTRRTKRKAQGTEATLKGIKYW